MRWMKKIGACLLTVCLLVLMCTVPVSAEELAIDAKGAILIEPETGKVLYEKNADEKLPPASVTKVMTLLLVCEAIDSGKIHLTDKVPVSKNAASMGGSQIWLKPGELFTVDEMLKAVAVGSANDCSVALGELIAGSEEGFIEQMNVRAKQLGMKNTLFVNCTGLDDDESNFISARDVATVSRELLKHKLILNYTKIWMDSLRDGKTALVNTNKLIRFYDGATGLKTGTTNKAGSCLSASATRNGMSLLSVVMGSSSSDARFESSKKLLDYGFSNYAVVTPAKSIVTTSFVKVLRGVDQQVPVSFDSTVRILVPKGKLKDIKYQIMVANDVMAPVEPGQTVGKAIALLDGKEVDSFPIKAMSAVERRTFKKSLKLVLGALLQR